MILMAADDSGHHHPKAKANTEPVSPSPSSAAPATRTRLHDFTFPTLSWGTHRLLRCSKDGAPASASPPPHPQTPSLQKEKPQGAVGASQPPRPWNLRTRRSATAAPLAAGSEGAGKAAAWQAQQPLASPPVDARKRGFSVALTKEEIAADFLAIRGARPPRRPKKRPRAVQRQLDVRFEGGASPNSTTLSSDGNFDVSVLNSGLVCSELQTLYPGLSLADVNPDSYKIEEVRHL
jgi:hypothetical protein